MEYLRLPNLSSGNTAEQIQQVSAYLYQLVEQLNYTIGNLDNASGGVLAGNVELSTNTQLNAEQKQQAFGELKALIIKSADIVNSYYTEIKKRLDGEYTAISDFGEFKQTTENTLTTSDTAIKQLYTNIQEITSAVASIENSLIDTQAWVRSGLLGYDDDGIPVYGVEVGQINVVDGEEIFNKYARFTAGGIYFYLPGIADAVAWMSGTKLYITNIELLGTVTTPHYLIDLSDGIAFKNKGGAGNG